MRSLRKTDLEICLRLKKETEMRYRVETELDNDIGELTREKKSDVT